MRKNPTTRKKRNKMIFKKKRRLGRDLQKHINCRGGLKQSIAEAALKSKKKQEDFQSILIAEEVLPLKQDIHGCQSISNAATSPLVTQKKYHRNFATTRKSTKSHSKRIKWRGYKCRRYRHSTDQDHGNIFTQKIQMLIKSMRIPIFHQKSPMKHRHHTNGEEWTATKQENSSTITKEENSVITAPS